jgi:hypothetical protein
MILRSMLLLSYRPCTKYNTLKYTNVDKYKHIGCMVDLWCLTPLSKIFDLYRGGGNRREPLDHIMLH